MEAWAHVRLLARQVRGTAVSSLGASPQPSTVVRAALAIADLEVGYFERPVDGGELGHYDRFAGTVQVVHGLDPGKEASVLAHELGHHHLHLAHILQIGAGRRGPGRPAAPGSSRRMEGYSSREYKEVQAEVFAAEFLCPTDALRQALVIDGTTPANVARSSGLPEDLVADQAARALLLPPLAAAGGTPGPRRLDAAQSRAARWGGGALLVSGSGGTGKTTTLLARFRHLVTRREVEPASILVLTASHRAAEEVRANVSQRSQRGGSEAWFGTLDEFAFELVAKWSDKVGLKPDFKVLDHTAALDLLEAIIEAPGGRADRLRPAHVVAARIFRDVQRRKRSDPHPTPGCADDDGPDGRVRLAYDEALRGLAAVDLGTVAGLAARLLETDADVLYELAARFQHVLVDDLEEADAAGLRVLGALQAAGASLWATTAGKASIYAYRVSKSADARSLGERFGAARLSLPRNHRSHPSIAAVADAIRDRRPPSPRLSANPGERVRISSHPSPEDEARAIRDVAEAWRTDGIPFARQAIIARSHLTLERMAANLRDMGVPVLHVGDLARRPETRDLLALLSLDRAPERLGLLRVACATNLAVTRAEARDVHRWAARHGVPTTAALLRAGEVGGLSPRAVEDLVRLGRELSGTGPDVPAARALGTWLFGRSAYLEATLADADDPENRVRLLAIHHLLRACEDHDAAGGDFDRLLARVRRLGSLDQRTRFRQVSDLLADVDAIRLCTMHASQGLTFGGVHVPAMAEGYVPAPWRGTRGASTSQGATDQAREEHVGRERDLLASVLSRAKHRLHLTWAARYARRTARPSRFLADVPSEAQRTASTAVEPARDVRAPPARRAPRSRQRPALPEPAVTAYVDCPVRYRLEHVEGLSLPSDGSGRDGANPAAAGRSASGLEAGRPATSGEAPLPSTSLTWPSLIGGRVGGSGDGPSFGEVVDALPREVMTVDLGTCTVHLQPDRVVVSGGTVRVQRSLVGPPSRPDLIAIEDALRRKAAAERFPGRTIVVETVDPISGERRVAEPDGSGRLQARYRAAVQGIVAGAFAPLGETNSRACPSCRWYLACDF